MSGAPLSLGCRRSATIRELDGDLDHHRSNRRSSGLASEAASPEEVVAQLLPPLSPVPAPAVVAAQLPWQPAAVSHVLLVAVAPRLWPLVAVRHEQLAVVARRLSRDPMPVAAETAPAQAAPLQHAGYSG